MRESLILCRGARSGRVITGGRGVHTSKERILGQRVYKKSVSEARVERLHGHRANHGDMR